MGSIIKLCIIQWTWETDHYGFQPFSIPAPGVQLGLLAHALPHLTLCSEQAARKNGSKLLFKNWRKDVNLAVKYQVPSKCFTFRKYKVTEKTNSTCYSFVGFGKLNEKLTGQLVKSVLWELQQSKWQAHSEDGGIIAEHMVLQNGLMRGTGDEYWTDKCDKQSSLLV